MQQVGLCCVCMWDSCGSECATGGFVLCEWYSWVVSVQQVAFYFVWDSSGCQCAGDGFVLCVGQFVV